MEKGSATYQKKGPETVSCVMLLFAVFVTKVVKIHILALPCLWVSAKLIFLLFVVGHSYDNLWIHIGFG